MRKGRPLRLGSGIAAAFREQHGPSSAGRRWTTRIPAPHPPHGPRPLPHSRPQPNWSGTRWAFLTAIWRPILL